MWCRQNVEIFYLIIWFIGTYNMQYVYVLLITQYVNYISGGKSMNPTYCILIFEPCSLILVVKPLEYLVKVQYQLMTWGIPRRGFAAQETSVRSFVQYAISSHFMRAEIEDSYIKLSIQSCCILDCMIWRLASEWYTIKMTPTHYYSDVTGALRRRNSPATQMFVQQLVLAIKK